MTGAWVFVCGPSGAGKDSVIGFARTLLAARNDIVFAQRIGTRPAPAGPDHQTLEPAALALLRGRAGLAWHWEAHGWHYAIAAHYARQVAWGRIVVVNGSREHVATLAQTGIRTVQISAEPEVLAARLLARGRDVPESVAQRLARNERFGAFQPDLHIVNDGALARAGTRLADFLASQALIEHPAKPNAAR